MASDTSPAKTFRPVSVASQLVIGASVALLIAATTYTQSDWKPPLWSETNARAREVLLIVGPWLAAIGAWAGGWRHTMAVGSAPSRGWAAIQAAVSKSLFATVTLSFTVGLAALFARTAFSATGGGPSVIVVVGGLLGAVTLVLLGYLVGVAWGSLMSIPVAALGAFVLLVAPTMLSTAGVGGRSYYSVALVWVDFEASIGWTETFWGGALRLIFLGSLAGATYLAALRAGERPEPRRVSLLTPFVVPCLIGGVLLVKQPVLVEPSTELTCEALQDTTICVPSEVGVLLPDVAQGAEAVVAQFGYGAVAEQIDHGGRLSDAVAYWYYGDNPESIRRQATIGTAAAISGQLPCIETARLRPGQPDSEASIIASLLASTLAARSGVKDEVGPPDMGPVYAGYFERLSSISDSQLRQFMVEKHEKIVSCSLGPADLGE